MIIDSSDDDMPLVAVASKAKAKAKKKVKKKPKRESFIDDSDSDDDMPLARLASKKKSKKSASSGKKVAKKKKKVSAGSKRKRSSATTKKKKTKTAGKKRTKKETAPTVKIQGPLKQLEGAMKANKWWEKEELPSGLKWRTLEHNGLMFPEPYVPHGIKLLYDGKPVDLNPEQEEVATFYASVAPDGPQLGNKTTANIFNKNFFADFKKYLGKGHVIKSFNKCDFSRIRAHLAGEREAKKSISKEEKAAKKAEADALKVKYSFALVDGELQKVGNTMVEPPGLFRGRGIHPKMGKVKLRVMPEQITLNIGKDAAVPPCPVPGHNWGEIVHKQDVTWLAYWNENIMGGFKYVWLAASSGFKGKSDRDKYEKARKLKKYISKIRKDYEKRLKARAGADRQRATAMWVIDRLALRAGNEKDDDEADTVGCCSLRVEHIKLQEEGHLLTMDFLGKDSMRHFQTYKLEEQYGEIGIKVYENFKKFCHGKKPDAEVFDQLTVSDLNDHLKSLMPGLSAKVFRTYNASITLEQQLPLEMDHATPVADKVLAYNSANRKVAILCNHQRTVGKGFQDNLDKLKADVRRMKKQMKELRAMLKDVKAGKNVRLKPEIKETGDKAKDRAAKKKVSHLFARQPGAEAIKKRLATWKTRTHVMEVNVQNKDDNKTVALGTSKINYMDPRITVAWAKRNECPIEKVFPSALRDKFPWAMSVPDEYRF